VAASAGASGTSPRMAGAAGRLRGISAVGYQRTRLAGSGFLNSARSGRMNFSATKAEAVAQRTRSTLVKRALRRIAYASVVLQILNPSIAAPAPTRNGNVSMRRVDLSFLRVLVSLPIVYNAHNCRSGPIENRFYCPSCLVAVRLRAGM